MIYINEPKYIKGILSPQHPKKLNNGSGNQALARENREEVMSF